MLGSSTEKSRQTITQRGAFILRGYVPALRCRKVERLHCRVALKSGKQRAIKSGKVLLIWKGLEWRGVKEDGGLVFFERGVAVSITSPVERGWILRILADAG